MAAGLVGIPGRSGALGRGELGGWRHAPAGSQYLRRQRARRRGGYHRRPVATAAHGPQRREPVTQPLAGGLPARLLARWLGRPAFVAERLGRGLAGLSRTGLVAARLRAAEGRPAGLAATGVAGRLRTTRRGTERLGAEGVARLGHPGLG
ncbi:MAG: hypothetical protein AUI14_20610 [Actinobacteria bacterium 13_2_20CM_2_71_6]|nr:MAG: hypothetical protein AUI14_20610 [Actinobacteria bacterium 13_2_20CM_2_71_6]